MSEDIFLEKRNGSKEKKDINKIKRVLMWACSGVDNVSVSSIEAQANLKIYDGMKTKDVQQCLVDAAHDLILLEHENYDLPAGRLAIYDIRKTVYGGINVDRLYDIIKRNVAIGVYDKELLSLYTEEQWDVIDSYIDHNRDFIIRYAGAYEFKRKYLLTNKKTKKPYETPQIAYAIIAAISKAPYVKFYGLETVKEAYDQLSGVYAEKADDIKYPDISIPTPVLGGCRSVNKQLASCVVIECGDSLDSITATSTAMVKYASKRAGLGVGMFNLRADKQPVADGTTETCGPIPFTQYLTGGMAVSQGGIRKGSVTYTHNILHKDSMSLLVLKNNKGTEETRVRHADHAFKCNAFILRKMLKDEEIVLFSPEEVPDLFMAMDNNQELFAELYEKYSNDTSLATDKVSGGELRDLFLLERSSTNRIYVDFMDNINNQSTFDTSVFAIRMSNLCVSGDTHLEVFYDDQHMTMTVKDVELYVSSGCEISVKSYNHSEKKVEYKRIINAALTGVNRKVVKVVDNNTGLSLVCTPDHKIYVNNLSSYVEAKDICDNDKLLLSDIYEGITTSPVVIDESNLIDVYDITVEDNNNFFANNILIHNCQEITLPTIPIEDIKDPDGLISLCNLGCANLGVVDKPSDLRPIARNLVFMIDSLLDYQVYTVKAAENSTKWFRPLGLGITNLAYFLAKRGLKYGSEECLYTIDLYMEHFMYYMLEASIELAKLFGPCEKSEYTRYSKGILPHDLRSKHIDDLIKHQDRLDWTPIREGLKKYGCRNATLFAQPPVETSSKVINSTNGVEPVKSLITNKDVYIVAPEAGRLRDMYESSWDVETLDYLKVLAVMQKRGCQAISANTTYTYKKYPNGVPSSIIFRDMLQFHKWGGKSLYYHNTLKPTEHEDMSLTDVSVEVEASCPSCVV